MVPHGPDVVLGDGVHRPELSAPIHRRGGHDLPPSSVPVHRHGSERLAAGLAGKPDGPCVVRSERRYPEERTRHRAPDIGAGDDPPPGPIPVLDQRSLSKAVVHGIADRPGIRGGGRIHVKEGVGGRRVRHGDQRPSPGGCIPPLGERLASQVESDDPDGEADIWARRGHAEELGLRSRPRGPDPDQPSTIEGASSGGGDDGQQTRAGPDRDHAPDATGHVNPRAQAPSPRTSHSPPPPPWPALRLVRRADRPPP